MTYRTRHFMKHHIIFKEGSRGDSAFLLQEGRVELSKIISGNKRILAVLKPIDLFGEMALISDDAARSATAATMDDVTLVEIKKDDFERLKEESPQIIQSMLTVLVRRLKTATVKSMQAPNEFKCLCLLLDMQAKHGLKYADYLHVVNTLSTMLNLSQDKAKAHISTLKATGLIDTVENKDGFVQIVLMETSDIYGRALERIKEMRAAQVTGNADDNAGEEDDEVKSNLDALFPPI